MNDRVLDRMVAQIGQQGNRLDKLRLQRALGQPFRPAEAENVLAAYQFPDGSWDYNTPQEQPERIGSLGGTIHCLRWLREFGLREGPQMTRTLDFLASIQAADGSFYETEAKLAHSPQKWLKQDTLIDRFYLTAAVPMRLSSLGQGKHPIVDPAIGWLALHWDDWALVTGTWYNLWALLCLYSKSLGLSAALYRRCHATALDWLPDLDAQPLTWLLDALHGAGFPADDRLVAKGMDHLWALQRKDGTWQAPDDSALETTITALRLLHDYGCPPGSGSMAAWEAEFLRALGQSDLPSCLER